MENEQKNFAIMRTAKIKSTSKLKLCEKHNSRNIKVDNADKEKTKENILLAGTEDALDAWHEKIHTHGVKVRKNAVVALEHVFSMSSSDNIDIEKWSKKTIGWLEKEYGKDNILRADLHLDEHTPHIHALIIPLELKKEPDKRKKEVNQAPRYALNAKKWTAGAAMMREKQTSYAKSVEEIGLSRGVKGSKAYHKKIKSYYKDLKEQYVKSRNSTRTQIVTIFNSINIFNYKKKAKKIKNLAIKLNRSHAALQLKKRQMEGETKAARALISEIERILDTKEASPNDLASKIKASIDRETQKSKAEAEIFKQLIKELETELDKKDIELDVKTQEVTQLKSKNNDLDFNNQILADQMQKLKPRPKPQDAAHQLSAEQKLQRIRQHEDQDHNKTREEESPSLSL